jgi:hypothetical protein
MAPLPKKTLSQKIDAIKVFSEFRPYLGGSYVGNSCLRHVYYQFRWYSPKVVDARINRLFRLGDYIDLQIIEALKSVGIQIVKPQESVGGFWDHADGHTDGRALMSEKELLFEAKSMSSSNYKKYLKVGLKEFKSDYWYQIHGYMQKLGLDQCLYVVYNKDTSDINIQIIDVDLHTYALLEQREMKIIVSDGPDEFDRIGGSSWYECKFCNDRDVCHFKRPPVRTCRSCEHVSLAPEGKWLCQKNDSYLSTKEQLKACELYEVEG